MSLASNSLVSLIGTGASALLSALFLSLGARWLGPVEYGEVGAALAMANVLFLALNPFEAGLTLKFAGLAGQRRLADLHSSAARLLRGVLIVSVALLLLWALACLLPKTLPLPVDGRGLFWLGVLCCAALAACVPHAVLRGREKFRALTRNVILESVVRLSVGLMLIYGHKAAQNMIAGYAVAAVCSLLHASFQMTKGLPAPSQHADQADADPWYPVQSYSAPLLLVHAYTALMLNFDVLAAKYFLSPEEAGLYAGAGSIARMVPIAVSPLVLVLFSRLASLGASGASTKRTVQIGGVIIVGSSLLSLLIPGLFGEHVLRVFLGDQFASAGTVLLYQWGAACILAVQSFLADALIATSRVRSAWLLLLPTLILPVALAMFHSSGLAIAQVTLVVSAVVGSAVYALIWRQRERRATGDEPFPPLVEADVGRMHHSEPVMRKSSENI